MKGNIMLVKVDSTHILLKKVMGLCLSDANAT